jgi:putative acetyltransferase
VRIVVDDLSGPAIAAFLDEHLTEMRAVTPPGSMHALDLDALRAPDVTFWTVWDGDALLACAALKDLGGGDGEIKSMRVAAERRGEGIADDLVRFVLDEARRRGWRRLFLETGSFAFFAPARRLYERHAFTHCPPFADYPDDPNSVHMVRSLTR